MTDEIQIHTIKMGRALGEAISKHVRASRLEEQGRPTYQANRVADAAFRRFLTRREQLVRKMVQVQQGA